MLSAGVDIGGTFTDLVLWDDEQRRATVHKLSSTPADPSKAALEGLWRLAELAGSSVDRIEQVFHGTTLATNVVVQHAGAKVGLITTRGFRDILHAARHKKPYAFSLFQDLPWQSNPIVPRSLRLTVSERITPPEGAALVPLDEDEVRQAAEHLRDLGVDAIAICFLFSFLNPRHEARAREICQSVAPDVFVCTSAEVIPQFREYERFSTTVLNAYVAPSVIRYIRLMADQLGQSGLKRELHLMNSAGGVITASGAAERPASLLMSGPVAGVLGGVWAARLSGIESVITLDVGGTSADIGVAPHGKLRMKHILDSTVAGYHTMMPMADCDSIGAGGGSIAFVDEGGVLRVGPRSAGADPGPACYGLGGSLATVTDAALVLGRLLPEGLLGGSLPLDPERAAWVVNEQVGQPLGLSLELAALGIIDIATQNMVHAIEMNSVRKGFDPRDFTLVAIGGAGPLFGCEIAAHMNIPTTLVPIFPGLTAALGLLASDSVYEFGITILRGSGRAPDADAIASAISRLEGDAHARLDADGAQTESRHVQRIADCRYEGQGYELRIECPAGPINDEWIGEVSRRFHAAHEREFYRSASDRPVQIVTLRVRATRSIHRLEWPEIERGTPAGPLEKIETWFRREGEPVLVETDLYARGSLVADQEIRGPAIVTQFESTIVIPPGFEGQVDRYGNLLISAHLIDARSSGEVSASLGTR